MSQNEPVPQVIRFGVFELNPTVGELRKNGIRLKLGEQPLRILQCLAARPGELVTREELQRLLWGEAAFVDAEHGLNAAINKLREALADSASAPRYIETVPRRGYRFLAEVTHPSAPKPAEIAVEAPAPLPPAPPAERGTRLKWWAVATAFLLFGLLFGAWWARLQRESSPAQFALRPLTADSGLTTHPALSRDGKFVAYASDRATSQNLDIWVHPLAPGGQPIRLTRHEADDHFPDVSPDGGLVVFRSERDGGGIYVVPALGGDERLLVRGALYPRFSPDGQSVAYCVGGFGYMTPSAIYTIPVAGGTPTRLAADVPWACKPAFSPDGRHVVFEGGPGENDTDHDWWVTPVAGGTSIKTGAVRILTDQLKLTPGPLSMIMNPLSDRCLFALRGQIWELDLSGPDWKAIGPARQLTSGGLHLAVRAGTGSRMVFANSWSTGHLWKLDVDHNRGVVLGEMRPVPIAGGNQTFPTASADGRLLAYLHGEPAGISIRLRNLMTAKDSTLVNVYGRPHLSPDGARLAYSVTPDSLFVMPSAGGEVTRLISPEQKLSLQAFGWTPDGKRIVYWYGKPIRYALFDPESGKSSDFLSHPSLPIYNAQISPDQRWVAFNTPREKDSPLWIASYHDGKVAAEEDWIRISDNLDLRPWWSPDGNLLYMVSRRDGFQCIWVQPLDPVTRHPKGAAFALHHFHSAKVTVPASGLAYFGPAILPGGLVFGLFEQTADVWLAEPQPK